LPKAVYCVIIGFASFDIDNKIIYEYSDIKGEPAIVNAKNINAYLVDSENIFIDRRSKPISKVPYEFWKYASRWRGIFIYQR